MISEVKVKKAIEYIKDFTKVNKKFPMPHYDTEPFETALEALHMQLKQEKVLIGEDCYGLCECGQFTCEGSNYCSGCGQRLLWPRWEREGDE